MVRGFFIFLIFICKKSVWDLVKKEYPRLTGFFTKAKTDRIEKSDTKKYEVFQLEIIAKEEKQIIYPERLI